MTKKIAVVSSTRAEYGLLSKLMQRIRDDDELELQVIVTGMHLSPEFGFTYRYIEEDGFDITAKVEMLMSSDTKTGMVKSMGVCLISLSEIFQQTSPDLLILLGDRYETLAVAMAALIQKIPVAHIHGGELSTGALDDAMRHAITKLSHLHFVATEPYRQRVIQLGENPETVFMVGAPGLERIDPSSFIDLKQLQKNIHFELGNQNFLLTFHPATLAVEESLTILQNIFASFDHFKEAKILITFANADEKGRAINQAITEYVEKHHQRAKAFVSLGDVNYLSLLQYVDVVIGNSSSGIIEVPYFGKPTVNIGERQAHRLRASSIIDCDGQGESIINAINKAVSLDFKKELAQPYLPYHRDRTAEKITHILKQLDFKKLIYKKFYDLGSQS